MDDVAVIDSVPAARDVLDPLRCRILAELNEPGTASTVAEALGESRQKVNYHVRNLEDHGLVRFVEERPRRGLSERVVVSTARSFVVSPAVLGESAADPARTDRLSVGYLLAVGARLVREVGDLARAAAAERKSLATLTIDTEIRFASAQGRAAFTEELSSAIATLTAKHHSESAPGGRWHRLIIASHPTAGPRTEPDPIPEDPSDPSREEGVHPDDLRMEQGHG